MAPLRSIGYTDPGWDHGVSQDEKKKKVKCNYCGKIVSGGIYRLKQHLARVSGEVKCCRKAPREVILEMKENLEGYQGSRKRRLVEDQQHLSNFQSNDEGEGVNIGYKWKERLGTSSQSAGPSITILRSSGFVDPGWEHGIALDEKKKKVKCNYCEKIVSGGINRFKQHLARIPGEVAYCKMAPEEVYLQIKENMKWHRTGWRRRPEVKEHNAFYVNSEAEEFLDDGNKPMQLPGDKDVCFDQPRRKVESSSLAIDGNEEQQLKLNYSCKSQSTSKFKRPKLKTGDIKGHNDVISAICKFFYYAAVPFSVVDSPYFHKMLDLVGQHGQGLKVPSATEISGRLLQNEVAAIKEQITEVKASWNTTGCTVILDNWKDVQGRTLMNTLVSCPRGTYYISCIDASDIIENVSSLFKLLDGVVQELGEENVVQVITENTDCFISAGKLLQENRRCLFWTPCAIYCIDQILEGFLKIKWVEESISKGQKITKFIYNHIWLLNLMREDFTGGRELLRSASTKFATSFFTLQSLLSHRSALKRLFQSSKWLSSQLTKSDEGTEIEKVVMNSTFWKKVQYICKTVEPLLNVIKKIASGEALPMPFIYNDIYRAKAAIKAIHGGDERKYSPFLNVIDSFWDSLFNQPLYLAAYFLNPSFRYRPDFMALPEVIRGLNECITRLEPDSGRRVSAVAQISDFVLAKADFGTELALSTRSELDPAAWWQQHGISCLELQRIAVRILSQTCSSFCCEHKWSVFDNVHGSRQNQTVQKRLDNFAYVHYNLRLRERRLKSSSDDYIYLDNFLLESLLADWVIGTEKTAAQENEEIPCDERAQRGSHQHEVNDDEYFDVEVGSNVFGHIAHTSLHPSTAGAVNDVDDADLDFLDEDYSD
ncbi:uncharacterized protein LOC110031575 [Phalaenopsis equestris]|uniref:uncharacterized protein LOC110031575 n=1 Tax=Phalaenopsis equestris TaxID=78828 RepID=UPI0009E5427E|nr:uncharacterized protein LOC110031575 [Phalaenopsis equestris]